MDTLAGRDRTVSPRTIGFAASATNSQVIDYIVALMMRYASRNLIHVHTGQSPLRVDNELQTP
jgi:hypothetical protein